ncbi:MAG: hypothetical protein HY275_14480 [Gemmatimonadetes bacterium]|nr:hypothetical protein [Gemmatimonadota bacterium]
MRRALVTSMGALGLSAGASHAGAQARLPDRLDDATFWRYMTEASEPWGTFRSENFVSNETSLQWPIPTMAATIKPGGVYVGVAPDQNFTYIVALKPAIAFIVDIRHQNAMEHLLYKALIEMSGTRAEFLARLFSRPFLDAKSAPAELVPLVREVTRAPADSARYRENLAAVKDRLMRLHRFALSDSEQVSLDCVYGAFFAAGPGLTYSHASPCATPGMFGGFGPGGMPTWMLMVAETDSAGVNHSYLASEANYRALKDMEERNLIVPLTGNFAGPKALRWVGQWARDRGAIVSTFYLSNVEQYLYQGPGDGEAFMANVATFPIDATSTFIRSWSFGGRFGSGPGLTFTPQSGRSLQLVSSIRETLAACLALPCRSYYDVLRLSLQ